MLLAEDRSLAGLLERVSSEVAAASADTMPTRAALLRGLLMAPPSGLLGLVTVDAMFDDPLTLEVFLVPGDEQA